MKVVRRLFMLVAVFCLTAIPLTAHAQECGNVSPVSATSESAKTSISPRADVIVMKFRVYNGVLQYRRWNETWGYWVDPYWKNVVV